MSFRKTPSLGALGCALIAANLLGAALNVAHAAPAELLISEYVEGSSNNKAIELFNGTASPIDLAAGNYQLKFYFNGGNSASLTIGLTGTVLPGQTYVIAHASASAALKALAQNASSSSGWFNGDDAIELVKGGVVIDSIGQKGSDPGTEWGTGLVSTADNTLRRKASVLSGRVDSAATFDPALEWEGFATDDFSGLGTHAVEGGSGDTGGGDTGGGDTGGGETGGSACTDSFTHAYQVQGSGDATPMAGQTVTIQGVVVADYEGPSPALRGFYLQDATGDGNPATSDAVFVFNGSNDNVSVGDVARVTGTVSEYQGQTQVSATAVAKCGTGSVAPTPIVLPRTSPDAFEAYEGMLVTVPQTLYVTEHYQLGRFGQVTLSADGRQVQPTEVAAPGAEALALQAQNALGRILVDDGDNAQNVDPIVFGRSGMPLSADNTLRGGDTVTGLTGVLTWTWAGNSASGNAWRIRPVNALGGSAQFEPDNARPTQAPNVGGNTTVGSINVLNYFNTLNDRNTATPGCFPSGTDSDCRGAESAAEFERQATKTVAAIHAMDADVVGLIEIENDGYGVQSALQDLVDRLNVLAGDGTYAFVDVDARAGEVNALGDDAIRVAMIYKPAKVRLVGRTAVLNSAAFVNAGDSAPRNRPALAQAFENADGARFIAVVNHLKSKGSACDAADALDGQGNCNVVRVRAANEMRTWLASDPTRTGDPDVLVMGDLNAYAKEDPVQVFVDAGYVDVVQRDAGADGYTYVFDGQWGRLDHALVSPSLAGQVSRAAVWHVSADEPSVLDYNTNFKSAGQVVSLYAGDVFRNSDHDPVLVGLELAKPQRLVGTAGNDVLRGTEADEVLVGLGGRDTLTGGGGRDRFVYDSVLEGGDTITDFAPGRDALVLTGLLRSLGIDGSTALAEGRVTCTASAAGALIGVDTDGTAGPARSRSIAQLRGVACGALSAGDYEL